MLMSSRNTVFAIKNCHSNFHQDEKSHKCPGLPWTVLDVPRGLRLPGTITLKMIYSR